MPLKRVKDLLAGDVLPNYGIVQAVLPANPWLNVVFAQSTKAQQWDPDAFVDIEEPARNEDSVLVGSWFVTDSEGKPIDNGHGRVFHVSKEEALVTAHSCATAFPDRVYFVCQQKGSVWGTTRVEVQREDFK